MHSTMWSMSASLGPLPDSTMQYRYAPASFARCASAMISSFGFNRYGSIGAFESRFCPQYPQSSGHAPFCTLCS